MFRLKYPSSFEIDIIEYKKHKLSVKYTPRLFGVTNHVYSNYLKTPARISHKITPSMTVVNRKYLPRTQKIDGHYKMVPQFISQVGEHNSNFTRSYGGYIYN